MSDNFLREEIRFCSAADRIIIGISGGADSVALTHILFSSLPSEKLLCAHVNHGIRGEEAQRDEDFVRNFCEQLGIELEILHADVLALSREWGMGEEECGRKVRYDFFQSLAKGEKDIIVTAHNADDNVETVLMNLIKGTGLKGLSGIPKSRGKIYRPILSMTREDIENYCKENHLEYVTDSTNLQTDYNRNKLRLKVIPVLREINSSLAAAVTGSAGIAAEAEEYIRRQAQELISKASLLSGLDADVLKNTDPVILKPALKEYLESKGSGRLDRKHIEAAAETVYRSGTLSIPGNLLLTVKQNILTVTPDVKTEDYFQVLTEGENALPGGKVLEVEVLGEEFRKKTEKIHNLLFYNYADYDKIISGLVATPRKEGDRFAPPKRNVTKTLKKLMNELKIPAALRDRIVIVRDGKEIVFAENIGVSDKYKIDKNTVRAVKFTVIPETEQ